jgi:methionyl-tRNA formyltransferase
MFFGSGRVALPSLKALTQFYPNLTVITQSSEGQKKSFNEIEKFCKENNIKWKSPIKTKDDKLKRKD